MVQIEDHVRTIYVRNYKPADAKSKDQVTGLDLSLSSELALYSCMAKAFAAQNDRDAEPNYPEAYASTREDIYTAPSDSLCALRCSPYYKHGCSI